MNLEKLYYKSNIEKYLNTKWLYLFVIFGELTEVLFMIKIYTKSDQELLLIPAAIDE